MTRYILECWNATSKKYEKFGEYQTRERAEIMFNKPYFRTGTRRLISVETHVIQHEVVSQRERLRRS